MKIDISKYKVFFFDFDGVLADTVNIKTQAFGELFREYGREVSAKVMEHHRNNGGVSRYEKIRHYYRHLLKKPMNAVIMKKLDKGYSELVFRKVVRAAAIKGAESFVKALNRKKRTCFVISATPHKEIRRIVRARGLTSFFRDTVGSPKNKVDNLKWLLRKYKVNPKEAVYFGDAKSDYEAAKQQGVDFIGVVGPGAGELKGLKGLTKIENFLVRNIMRE